MIWLKFIAILSSLLQPGESGRPPASEGPDTQRRWCVVHEGATRPSGIDRLSAASVARMLPSGWAGCLIDCAPGAAPDAASGVQVSLLAMAARPQMVSTDPDEDGDEGDDEPSGDTDRDDEDESPAPPQGQPWIGIQLAPVPEMLATHLNLEDKHLMVLNIVVDSPADRAGLRQYDVILRLNGNAVDDDPEAFADAIRRAPTDKKLRLTIRRGSEQKDVELQPVVRDSRQRLRYKYKIETPEVMLDTQEQRGGMFRRGANGQWEFVPFTVPIPPIAPVPPVGPNAPAAPRPPNWDEFFRVAPEVKSNVVIVETNDNVTTEVKRDASGRFRVSRTTVKDGKTETTTRRFANEDEFRRGDPKAFELYSRHRAAGRGAGRWNSDWQFRGADDQLRREMERAFELMEQARAQLERAQREAGSARERARDARPRAGVRWPSRERQVDVRIEAQDDGRIRVTRRDGDQELVQTYKSADDLKARDPKMFERFERMRRMEADEPSPNED